MEILRQGLSGHIESTQNLESEEGPASAAQWAKNWRQQGLRVGLVPTMGALHQGHLSLVRQVRQRCDRVMATIYVNPTQFGAHEDFDKYPQMLESDLGQLRTEGVDAVYLPQTLEMYPDGFETFVINQRHAKVLCGRSRPDHFQGVLTIVLKLFHIVRPHIAIFGLKDYQQFFLIKRMVRDLSLEIEVMGSAVIRADDGLALSSRNLNLTSEERACAPLIYLGLQRVKELVEGGENSVSALQQAFLDTLKSTERFKVDYFELRDPDTLALTPDGFKRTRAFVAAYLGSVRLIDNLGIGD